MRATRKAQLASIAFGLGGLALVATGCGPTLTASAGTAGSHSDASIVVSPAPGSSSAQVDTPVVVKADDGRLSSVVVMGDQGPINGAVNAEGTVWTSAAGTELPFSSTFRVTASAVDAEGRPTEVNDSFTTITPPNRLDTTVKYVSDGGTYGVGMPIALSFNAPVTARAEVENRLKLTSSIPVEGAWSWNDEGTRVTFRPKAYWPANDHVTLNADLYGLRVNDDTYGVEDTNVAFSTGDALVMNVDANTLRMIVTDNGVQIADYPVTTGKSGFETREGIKVISAKEGTVIMDAATTGTPVGSSEYYRLTVDYSMRLTDSGEFIHAAPWSVGSQGVSSVSHGCIGMSTGNAAALYSMARPGDVVVVTNTGRPTTLGNGITVWNESWPQWLANSATGAHVIGPNGEAATASPAAKATAPAA